MSAQGFWTGPAQATTNTLSQEVFTIIFLAIVIGWIIVALWTRVIDNVSFNVLGLRRNSAWDTLLIAFGVTIFFLALVWMIDRYGIVSGSLAATFAGEDDPVFSRGEVNAESGLLTSFTGAQNASIPTLFPSIVGL